MRSKLFVPGFSPELFDKALSSPADAISFDLEDAVDEDSKDKARTILSEYLKEQTNFTKDKTIVVRINGSSTTHFHNDIDAAAQDTVHIINLPKVEHPSDITDLCTALKRIEKHRHIKHKIGILATIESPLGLRCALQIAKASPRVMGLQLGFGDLFSPLGIAAYEPFATQHVRMLVRMAAAEANVNAYDGGYVDLDDTDGFLKQAKKAKALGFAGKTCVHPSQVQMANDTFRPSEAEVDLAVRVVAAAQKAREQGQGVFVVEGKLYDGPFTIRAEQIVLRAQQIGMI